VGSSRGSQAPALSQPPNPARDRSLLLLLLAATAAVALLMLPWGPGLLCASRAAFRAAG
jgi:hypothetical protein